MLWGLLFTISLAVPGFASAKETTPVCNEVFTAPLLLTPLQDRLESSNIKFEDHAWFVVIAPEPNGETLNQLAFFVQSFYRRNLVLLTDRGAEVQMNLENDEDLIIYFPEVLLQFSNNMPVLKELIAQDFRAMFRRDQEFADKALTIRNAEFAQKMQREQIVELMMH